MGVFGFLPPVERCCWCTRKFKFASVLLLVWSMVAALHGINMVFHPACKVTGGDSNFLTSLVIVLRWFIFINCLFVIIITFAFMLALSLSDPREGLTADIYIGMGFCMAGSFLTYMLFSLIVVSAKWCKPTNFNDVILSLFYTSTWIYSILIINTYRNSINDLNMR